MVPLLYAQVAVFVFEVGFLSKTSTSCIMPHFAFSFNPVLPSCLSDSLSAQSPDALLILAALTTCWLSEPHKHTFGHFQACLTQLLGLHAVFGTVLISRQRPPCLEQGRTLWHSRGVVDVIIWTTWAVLAAMAGSVFATYSFFPQYNSQKSW